MTSRKVALRTCTSTRAGRNAARTCAMTAVAGLRLPVVTQAQVRTVLTIHHGSLKSVNITLSNVHVHHDIYENSSMIFI